LGTYRHGDRIWSRGKDAYTALVPSFWRIPYRQRTPSSLMTEGLALALALILALMLVLILVLVLASMLASMLVHPSLIGGTQSIETPPTPPRNLPRNLPSLGLAREKTGIDGDYDQFDGKTHSET
tara:strand:- start:1376 stop:1750 length:375 start_codon:yes stop_codon:yes gene_type:complete